MLWQWSLHWLRDIRWIKCSFVSIRKCFSVHFGYHFWHCYLLFNCTNNSCCLVRNYLYPVSDLYAPCNFPNYQLSPFFWQDNNLGLVKQVLTSMYKRNIQRLTQTYLTLSLEDIARSVQLDTPRDAEMHVLRMVGVLSTDVWINTQKWHTFILLIPIIVQIEDGEIHATINQKDGMVSFHEDPEQYKSVEMVEHIDSSIQRCVCLTTAIDVNNHHSHRQWNQS